MKFDSLKIIYFASWCLSLLVSGARGSKLVLYFLAITAAGGSLFLHDPQHKVMSWFTGIWIAYLISSTEGKRSVSGLAQKQFMIQIMGALYAVFGVALIGFDSSLLLVLVGVLIATPAFVHSLFFNRFYASMTKRGFFFSVTIPSLVAIDLLFSVKPEIKQAYPMVWEVSLFSVGGLGLITSSMMALVKNRTKSVVVFLTHAWIAASFFLLAADGPNVQLALASIAVLQVNGWMIFLAAKRCSVRYSQLITSVLIGIPCFVGFNALFYSMRALEAYSVAALILFLVSFLFQAGAVTLNLSKPTVEETPNLRLWLLLSISFASAIAIHVMGMNYALD